MELWNPSFFWRADFYEDLSDNEKVIYNSHLDKISYFYELWTKKETYYKYLGTGINISDLSKIKNVTILTGTHDILNPDIKLLKQKAEKIGAQIKVKEYERANHIWMIEKNCTQELIEQGYQDVVKLIKGEKV